ncbi:phosphomannomutase/phosphoglucomutase [Candidatus Woesearchaeota archaeon]|nr:phosphomannomutase/phosphoglucomutase [Candidatus Woesearchaeota archaeon]
MSIFKAYDVRGTYPDQLNKEIAYKIGRAFVTFLDCKNVVVAKDMRDSSNELEEALIEGILDQGRDVISIGLSSTPMMYFAVSKFGYDAGIMITASHNPKQYNGFKFVREKAIPLSGKTGIKDIEKIVKNKNFAQNKDRGIIEQRTDILQDYILNGLSFQTIKKLKKLKIAVDYGNGMGALIGKKFFPHLNCEIVPLYSELDGNFPNHEANPLKEENLKDLKKLIIKEKADFGIAWDGDADRLFFVDEKTNTIGSDKITALIAQDLLQETPKLKILYDLRSSKIVPEIIEKNKGWPIITRVGHSFIKEKMRKEEAIFAGELSGHFYLKDNYYFESPFFIILRILELITKKEKTLSELIEPLNKYYATGEINSEVDDKQEKIKELAEKYKDAKKIFYLDGISIEFDSWWFNVRPSNTEPLLRLNLEADTKKLMEEKKIEVLKIIRS